MVANVSSLLKTVKTAEDEAARGVRALESAIDAISAQLEELTSDNEPTRDAAPEDVIRVSKGVTIATAKAVAAGNSGRQDDVTAAANLGRKAIIDMLLTTKVRKREIDRQFRGFCPWVSEPLDAYSSVADSCALFFHPYTKNCKTFEAKENKPIKF